MGELQEIKTVKKDKKQIFLTSFIFLFLILSVCIGYFIYSHQITRISDIYIDIKQSQNYELPHNIPVILRNNTVKVVSVKWNSNKIDTSIIGRSDIKGVVKGYRNNAFLHINVKPFAVVADSTSEKILQGEKYKLPDTTMVLLSDLDRVKLLVNWKNSNIDINKPGKYIIQGYIAKNSSSDIIIDKNIDTKFNLEIIDKNETIKNMFEKSKYDNTAEVRTALETAELLPDNIIKKLINDRVSVDVVDKIEDPRNLDGAYNGYSQLIEVVYIPETYENSGLWNEDHIYNVLLHEIGHAFDYNRQLNKFSFSDTDEFKKIESAEGTKILNNDFSTYAEYRNYFLNDIREYFAECFSLYFSGDKTKYILKQKAPLTYQYIEKAVSNEVTLN